VGALAAAATLLVTAAGTANDGSPTGTKGGESSYYLPRGVVELGLGVLTLPTAELCVDSQGTCVTGDSSLLAEGWTLVRPWPQFAIGAGLGLGANRDDERLGNSTGNVTRVHGHGYFTAEVAGRWIPLRWGAAEGWLVGTTGLVVVNDSFRSTATTPTSGAAFVGPSAATVRTEGLSMGVGVGGSLSLAERWALASSLRANVWWLPSEPATDALGDEAALRGVTESFTIAVYLRYEVPL
jgi:hypothetical protein